MSLSDFQSISGLLRAYLRSEGGPTAPTPANGETITGWVDASAAGVDATMEDGSSRPEYRTAPAGGLEGPSAYHDFEFGFSLGSVVDGLTTWTFATVLRADSLTSFRNIFSSGGGAATGSLYCNAGVLTYQEASTESTGETIVTGEVYTIIFTADASNYRLYLDGTLIWTSTMVPGDQPNPLVTSSYGGSGAAWSGDWWAIAVYGSTVSGTDIVTLDAALREEAEGAAAPEDLSGASPGVSTAAGALALAAAIAGASAGAGAASGSLSVDDGEMIGASASVATVAGTLFIAGATTGISDSFDGDGALIGYTTVNASSLSNVTRTSGRYRAAVTGNTVNATTHFNALLGRADAKEIAFPFEVEARGVRVAIPSDPDTEPSVTDEFLFCGIQINNDLDGTPTAAYQHLVVGHRGSDRGRTVERKTTIGGVSTVNDVGIDAVTVMAIDIRAVGTAGSPNTVNWYYREEGDTAWIGPLAMPGTEPSWSSSVWFCLVTYAFEHYGPDFAGYIDAIVETATDDEYEGASNGVGASSAALSLAVSVDGASNGVGSSSGALSLAVSVDGASNGVGAVTGDLSALSPGALEGAGIGAATATGSLSGTAMVEGAAAGVGDATGTLAIVDDSVLATLSSIGLLANAVKARYETDTATNAVQWYYGADSLSRSQGWPRVVAVRAGSTYAPITRGGRRVASLGESRIVFTRRSQVDWHCWAANDKDAESLATAIVLVCRRLYGADQNVFVAASETWPSEVGETTLDGGALVILSTEFVFEISDEVEALSVTPPTSIGHTALIGDEEVC